MVASVRGRTLFLTVMLLVWIRSIYFLSEASHKKLIPLSVFHLHWTENIGFVLCNHKCFETCLIEMLYLLFCRVFSSRNHRGNLDSEQHIVFSPLWKLLCPKGTRFVGSQGGKLWAVGEVSVAERGICLVCVAGFLLVAMAFLALHRTKCE